MADAGGSETGTPAEAGNIGVCKKMLTAKRKCLIREEREKGIYSLSL